MTEPTQPTTELPASALPEGMDATAYAASLAPAPAAPASTRPDHIPEKFWDAEKQSVNVEALLKSQSELEKQFTQTKQAPAVAEAATDPAADPDKLTIERPADKAEDAPAVAPLASAVEAFKGKWEETKGAVTEDDYKPLIEAGLSKDMIDTYLEGIRAQETLQLQAAYGLAGGEDNFKAASEWASRSMSDEDLATYNDLIATGKSKAGVEWLMAKYQTAQPSEGSFVEGEASSSPGDVFRSTSEMTAAINDPRYRADRAYQADVAAKIGRSMKAGTVVNHGRR